ncbi:MAG: AAA family ATPase [Muribaculaceae bacterium]|nr:AAA family ATPase [Muribaculaceae bacterium]
MAFNTLIGRTREIRLLDDYMASGKAEFIAIYGRRRIGKTFLVKQYFEDQFDFYVTGIYDNNKREQLFNFNRQLNKYSGVYYPIVNDWFEAFAQLQHYLDTLKDKKRIVVFIDELPWLDTPRSKFIRALELFWNEWASSLPNFKFIVCGSATTWMASKLLGDKGGLHNRVTRPIRLQSFTLAETERFLLSKGFQKDRLQTLEAYMILGGIPFYLDMLQPRYSITQNIDEMFFSESSPLREEYSFLFRSLFNNATTYHRIIEFIASKAKGMTKQEIVKGLKIIDNGNLSEALENLCRCDFLRRYNSYGKKERDMMYQLVDHYCLFYLRFVKNDNSQDRHRWSNSINDGVHKAWTGYAFEQVCLRHIEQIKDTLNITNIMSDVSSWQVPEAQIDLVIDRKDRIINLCEMKYSDKPFSVTKTYLERMNFRRELFRERTKATKALHLTMVSPLGIKDNAQREKIQSVVTLDDLFEKF